MTIVLKTPITHFSEAASILIFNRGKVLTVSRKDNHTKFSLPGGKLDLHEDPERAARRELLEETGYKLDVPIQLIFEAFHVGEPGKEHHGYWCKTFAIVDSFYNEGEVLLRKVQEPEVNGGIVVWNHPQILIDGPFGEYNLNLFKSIKNNYLSC
jgi:8-oxo-dGTP pyrophosphatase MutT (NUDIX family)